MSVISENDQQVARCLLDLFQRGIGGCDGFMVTSDQVFFLTNLMHQPALPRVPVMKIVFTISQIDQIIGPKIDGSPGYTLMVGWTNDKLFWLDIGTPQITPDERDRMEALGRLARAEVFFPDGGLRFCWS